MAKAKQVAKKEETKVESNIAKEDVKALKTKSSMIRFYLSKGYARKTIATHLGIRYQHVRNVEVTLLKKDMKK